MGGFELLTPREIADGLADLREEARGELESSGPHATGEGSGSREHTTAQTARRFQLLRGSSPRTPEEERIVAADVENTKGTLAQLENGHGPWPTRGVSKEAPPATW
jgi:hypothetical protein